MSATSDPAAAGTTTADTTTPDVTTPDVTTPDVTVPPRLRRLWNLDATPRKGPRPGLSRDEIASAAVAIADAEGLAAVSMSRVAQSLGYTTMSLYRYVESKDELIGLMWDIGLSDAPDIDLSRGWRPALEEWALTHLRITRRHPWSLDIPITNPPLSPRQVAWMEKGLAALADTPLDPEERLGVILTVTVAVLAEARLSRDLAQGGEFDARDYGHLLRRLVDRDTHPHLMAVVDSGVFEHEQVDPDEDFMFSLGLTLDGIEQLIRQRS